MKKMFLVLIFVSFSAMGSENDSLTNRYRYIQNSKFEINKIINGELEDIKQSLNANSRGCEVKQLMKASKKKFVADIRGAFVFSPMQRLLERDLANIQTVHIKMNKSIYKYVKKVHAPVLKLFKLSPTLRIDNSIIGSDKFSHFFNLGWEYYGKLKKGKSLEEVLSYSKKLEENFWGGPTTGVVSHSDLMANFQGLRFFGHLSGQGQDPLLEVENSTLKYFNCIDGKWSIVREFDLANYFGAEVDEGINCNKYHTKKIEDAVFRSIVELQSDGNSYFCPILTDKCEELSAKYQKLGHYLLSPKCL
jgi:hypothetical protein